MIAFIANCLIVFLSLVPEFNLRTNSDTILQQAKYNINITRNIRNVKTVKLSQLGKELQYIPLETKTDYLIKEIDKIEFSDSFIFVSETRRLLEFDMKGKFIRQIGSVGRGPEEYLSVPDFCIDKMKHEVYIISNGKLLIYGFDGHFIKSINLSFRPSQLILKDQNTLMYHLYNIPGPINGSVYSWIITDKQGISLVEIDNTLKRVSKPGMIVGDTPLYKYNNTVHFMEFGIDTLYFLSGNQKRPYANIILGDLKIDPDPVISPETRAKVADRLRSKLSIKSILENNEYMFIEFLWGLTDYSMRTLYNKNTNETIVIKENFFEDDLSGGIPFWPKTIISDSIMLDYFDAYDLLHFVNKMKSGNLTKTEMITSTNLYKLSSQLTETSNPVLIILKK